MTASILVEVDVATRRPPARHAQVWVWVAVERNWAYAVEVACQMAACHPQVIMPIDARVIDWKEAGYP